MRLGLSAVQRAWAQRASACASGSGRAISSASPEGQSKFAAGREGDTGAHPPDEPPPSAAHTFGLMGAGAIGAIAVAAVGVYGVLQMALLVASSTGRSLNKSAEEGKVDGEHATSTPKAGS